jgi:hypothetical protein
VYCGGLIPEIAEIFGRFVGDAEVVTVDQFRELYDAVFGTVIDAFTTYTCATLSNQEKDLVNVYVTGLKKVRESGLTRLTDSLFDGSGSISKARFAESFVQPIARDVSVIKSGRS